MNVSAVAAALHALADALVSDVAAAPAAQAETAAPAGKRGKKAAAAESAPPAPAPAAAASAPAPATAPVAAPTFPDLVKDVNPAILALASINRPAAKAILAKFGVAASPELKKEQYQAVIDAMEEEKARIDAAAAQASLV